MQMCVSFLWYVDYVKLRLLPDRVTRNHAH